MAAAQQLALFVSQSEDFELHRSEAYPPLDVSRREIRLLTLHAGNVDDQIRITLEKASLDGNPLYEAISYTWEDLSQTRIVNVHGHDYVVSKNQFEAVRHFRFKDTARVLWMDVFCIDQANLSEKGSQVSIMGEIYAGASTTLVWLGQFNEDWIGTIDFAQLEKATEALTNSPDLPRMPEDSTRLATSTLLAEFNYAAEGDKGPLLAAVYVLLMLAGNNHLLEMPIYSVDDEGNPLPNLAWYKGVETLRLILNRPWWERAWVLQEVAWSKQPPMVHMGSFTIPLNTFCDAGAALVKHVMYPQSCCTSYFQMWCLRDVADTEALITRVPLLYGFRAIRDFVTESSATFEEAMAFSSNKKVSDPRDCIYSLLSLVPKEQRVHVDYNYTVAETFTSASWMSIKLANSLNRLQHGGAKNRFHNWPLPSWVRDWSRSPTYRPFFDWIHNIKTYTLLPDWNRTIFDANDNSLTVPHVTLDIVEACFPAIVASLDWRFHVLTAIWLQQLQDADYTFDLITLIRTVFRNTGVNTHSPSNLGDMENLAAFYLQYSEPQRSAEPEPPGFTLFDLQFAFSSSIRESCLFVTKQKRLGIGYEAIRPGDILCHVRGCCVPLAVRKIGSPGPLEAEHAAGVVERFTMVDACYIDGDMDLENSDVDWDQAKDLKLV